MGSTDKQLQFMQDFLINIADGNFDAKLSISNESDEELVNLGVTESLQAIYNAIEEYKQDSISILTNIMQVKNKILN